MVGLGALVILAGAAVKLPGRAVAAAVICLLLVIAAAAYILRAGQFRIRLGDIGIVCLSLLFASVVFLANGHVGLPGDSLDNDMARHLLWADALRSSRMAALWLKEPSFPPGYPLGPHSVVAALGSLTSISLDLVFTGLLLAIGALTALVGAGLLTRRSWWRRALVGLMCASAYLVAAYYAEGSFKETLMAGLLLAFVLHLEQVQARWGQASATTRWQLVVPAVVLAAAGVYTYSYLGVIWFAATLGIWAVAEALVRPTLVRAWISRRPITANLRWLIGAAALGIVLVLPEVGDALAFRSSANTPIVGGLGNLLHPLPVLESFGIWFGRDFRIDPMIAVGIQTELSLFALGVALFGFAWAVRRRRLLLPAAAVGSVAIWWYTNLNPKSPYVASKALVIATPLLVALGLRALLGLEARRRSVRVLGASVALLFSGLAAYSSVLALQNEPVLAPESVRELASFAPRIGDSQVLYLGLDEFAPWELRPASVVTPPGWGHIYGQIRPSKPYSFGVDQLDFDSIVPTDLNNFRYVITSDTSYQSQPPANFRLVASERLYDLWERTGPTPIRWEMDASNAPGAILDCRTSSLGSARGTAAVMADPVVLPGFELAPGKSTVLSLALPRGQWQLSLQYFARLPLAVSVDGQRWTMPAFTGTPGPFFNVGTVTGRGVASPVKAVAKESHPSFLTGSNLIAYADTVVAVRLPNTRRLIPLRDACGKYVDWFTLS